MSGNTQREGGDQPVQPEAKRGRPVKAGLRDRVLKAAMKVYSENGWAGFTYDAIAREAPAGKSAIYSRWPHKTDLMLELIENRWSPIAQIDKGSFEADMREFMAQLLDRFGGNQSRMSLNMQIDSLKYQEISDIAAPNNLYITEIGRKIVLRAIARGEISARNDPDLIHHVVYGSLLSLIELTTHQSKRVLTPIECRTFSDDLMGLVQRGLIYDN